jgi:GntR family transcriptional repressor for pyruvate dehydrogenase complex
MLQNNKKNLLHSVDRPPRLSEQVALQLKEAILKEVYNPGELLPSENQLTEIFSVSRNVVREALMNLQSKGLIEIIQGKGAYVLEPSINPVLDPFSLLINYKCGEEGLSYVLKVRELIEPTVAKLSARHRTDLHLEKMKEYLNLMETYREDKIKISQHDINFHNQIAISCKNPIIPIVLEPIFHFMSRFHPPIFFDSKIVDITLEYHKKIFHAIEHQQEDLAYEMMCEHLKLSEKHNIRLSTVTQLNQKN